MTYTTFSGISITKVLVILQIWNWYPILVGANPSEKYERQLELWHSQIKIHDSKPPTRYLDMIHLYFFIWEFLILSIYYPYTNYPYTNYPYVIYIIYIIPFNFIYTSTGATFLHRKKPPAAVQQPRPQDGPWLWHGPLEEQLGHQWRVEDHVRITNGDLKMGDFSEMSPKIWLG